MVPVAQMGGWVPSRIMLGSLQNLFSIALPDLILFLKARFFLDFKFDWVLNIDHLTFQ